MGGDGHHGSLLLHRPQPLEAAPWPLNTAGIPLLVHTPVATLLPVVRPDGHEL
jgi:hypothetical protein